jgi:hypothetical protein
MKRVIEIIYNCNDISADVEVDVPSTMDMLSESTSTDET